VTANILDVRDVSFAYGQLPVLFDLSMHVGPGEAVGLLGTNGAGKSTLLRVIAGLEKPTSGTIALEGPDVVAERRERVLATFPAVASRLRQHAGRLSGGEQQQLALAKALLLDPKVLCIDELSLGLAPVVVGELMEIVREIHRSGVSIVVVEQSLNIAAQLCERSIFLEKGQVRFEGRTADLLEQDDIARAVFFGAS
jgi:ABC-type branched-subunit amino acid transport system ATPase component